MQWAIWPMGGRPQSGMTNDEGPFPCAANASEATFPNELRLMIRRDMNIERDGRGRQGAFEGKTSGMHVLRGRVMMALAAGAAIALSAAETNSFDGRPWNVSSGNLSVSFIQGSPIGAFPKPDFLEAPPSVESQARLKAMGLVANEDYIAWG